MKFTRNAIRNADAISSMDAQSRDQYMLQNYGTTYDGLSVVMSQAEKLRNGQDLTPSDYRELVAQFGGQVPPERLARLMHAVDNAGDSNSRARAYLKDLIQDTQRHRLGESYKLLDNFSQLNAQQLVDERMAERAAKESEWDRAQGKDKIKPFSEWDPSALNSTAHQRHVRANIEEALDEHLAQKPMSQNTRLGVLVDAQYGDSNIGDIFRNRASEESGESNTIRSDLGESISQAYDQTVADAIDFDEGNFDEGNLNE